MKNGVKRGFGFSQFLARNGGLISTIATVRFESDDHDQRSKVPQEVWLFFFNFLSLIVKKIAIGEIDSPLPAKQVENSNPRRTQQRNKVSLNKPIKATCIKFPGRGISYEVHQTNKELGKHNFSTHKMSLKQEWWVVHGLSFVVEPSSSKNSS